MVTAKDRAIKLNAPLRSEIAELKKKLTAEAEALKSSQDGRDQDRAKHIQEWAKKETEATSLLHQAKKAASESDHSRKDLQKKVDQLTVDLLTTKSALALKTTELETNVLDADGARNELEETRKQFNKLEIGRIEWEAEVVRLRKQLEEAQSSLLSSRTNQRVEEDRIQKSVEVATAARDERIKLLEIELNDLKNEKWALEQARKSDEKNIRELFQDKYALKEKNQELEEKLLNIAAVQQSLEQDLTEGRAKIKRLEEQLLLSRAVA
jgi:chromosome segregation ATPase